MGGGHVTYKAEEKCRYIVGKPECEGRLVKPRRKI